MKTRKSNRTKTRGPVDTYPDDVFEDEIGPPSASKVQEDDDGDFHPPSLGDMADGASADPDEMDVDYTQDGQVDDDDDESEFAENGDRSSPRKGRKMNRPTTTKTTAKAGYMDVTTTRPSAFVQHYTGPYDRGVKGKALVRAWYGSDSTMRRILDRWYSFAVLPPKDSSLESEQHQFSTISWLPEQDEKERTSFKAWYDRMKAAQPEARFSKLSPEEGEPYRAILDMGQMPTVLGPTEPATELQLNSGDAIALDSAGVPLGRLESAGRANAGWLLDAGGIVLSLAWKASDDRSEAQILALTVVPHADQDVAKYEVESNKPGFQQHGIVQIWAFQSEESSEGYVRASERVPKRQRTLCLDRGRAKKVQWSPLGGLLAVLCDYGGVYVVEPERDGEGDYEKVESPVAVLDCADEAVGATAMTWINCNRISVGYTDGSIALWSIFPKRLLSRHPVHHSHVMNMASAYPTFPYLVSSTPVGGPPKLIDIRSPSYETTESTTASVTTSAGVMTYSDHLLGFHFALPSSNALNTVIGFSHHAYYAVSRRIATPDSFVTCISAGRTHPFLLIGTLDGSLWSLNPQTELFSSRYEVSDRIRVLQHGYRNAAMFEKDQPGSERGAARILQGFRKVKNPNPRNEVAAAAAAAKKGPKKGKGKATAGPESSKDVIQETLTRITAVEWNPNPGYGCWAAVAMGSGLLKIMDLGLEPPDAAD